MPTYQFRCPSCGADFEEKRGFARSDEPADCPVCGEREATRVFSSAMFFSPGSAAKAMLEKPAARPAPVAHGSGCPCCSGACRA